MSEYLVIRPNENGTAQWVLVNELGAQLAPVRHGELADAANMSTGRQVIALIPAAGVLRTSVELPVRGTAKMLQALPYAMEDQLAEDVENLHFAIGARDADGRIPVAVIHDEKMARWVSDLQDADLTPAAVYSEGDVLGDIPGTAIILIEASQAILRDTDGNLATVDHESLQPMLELWLAARNSSDDDEESDTPAPTHILVYVDKTLDSDGRATLNWLREQATTLDEKLLDEGPLPRMAAQAVNSGAINLLQGPYSKRSDYGALWPAWRVAAMLLLGFTVLFFGFKGAQLAMLNQQAAALDSAIEQAFRYTFPEVREIRDPRAQLDSKLRSLSQSMPGVDDSEFLKILQTVADSVAGAEGAQIEAISYRSGIMDLRIRAGSVEVLDQIQKKVSSDGELRAEIQSADADGDRIMGRLQIQSPGV